MFDHFNLLAPIYDRLIRPRDPGKLVGFLGLPAPGCLLDAGGGTGRVALGLRPYVDELVICDSSEGMLRQAKQKKAFMISAAQTECLPYPDNYFDRVLTVDALHHFENQQQSISELLRVLKPGGRLVIEEPDLTRFIVKLLATAEKIALMRSQFYTPEEIETFVQSFGYVARVERDNNLTAWVIVNK